MNASTGRNAGRLGTFGGVFTPSVLTILGLILFLRLGYVVGAGGLRDALLILAGAHVIAILTSLSLAAISTNVQVKGGGVYYLISRSLGVEFGGALGVVLFLAQSISVAFYLIGFAEVVTALLPAGGGASDKIVAGVATLLLFVFAWLGAEWATRLQYVVMAALVLGLVSFFAGAIGAFSGETLAANWSEGAPGSPGFWLLFAIFFPAVTGFTQGASLSGDLENPGKSLPSGTFAAVGVSMVVYFGAAIVFGGAMPAEGLVADFNGMQRLSWAPPLIVVGIVAATVSSAMASFLGAPRILQALAKDRVFPILTPFAAGHGPASNPRRAVFLTLVIALGFVALGGIDFIAPILSMFFLISYALLNYATALEAKAASPSFRPKFRYFHYRASLVGAWVCFGAMVMINAWASALASALLFALYQYLQRIAPPVRWADSRRDHYFQKVRENLMAMAAAPVHARNWRPHFLVLSEAQQRRDLLVRFASWMEGESGLTTVVRILLGHGPRMVEKCREAQKEIEAYLEKSDVDAFALVVAAVDLEQGVQTLLQAHGLGPICANSVLLNWLETKADATQEEARRLYIRNLGSVSRFGANAIVLDAKESEWKALREVPAEGRRIDVWWFEDASSRLMLLLAYLMTRCEEWRGATLRLLVPSRESKKERTRARFEDDLEEMRIEADIQTVDHLNREKITALSKDGSLVFLPLRFSRGAAVDPFGEPLAPLLDGLPVVALVSAAEDIDLEAQPDTGEPARVAELTDALAEARKMLAAAGKEEQSARDDLAEAVKAARRLDAERAEATDDEKSEGALAKARSEASEAKERLKRVETDARSARERVEEAQRDLARAAPEAAEAKAEAPAADGEAKG